MAKKYDPSGDATPTEIAMFCLHDVLGTAILEDEVLDDVPNHYPNYRISFTKEAQIRAFVKRQVQMLRTKLAKRLRDNYEYEIKEDLNA